MVQNLRTLVPWALGQDHTNSAYIHRKCKVWEPKIRVLLYMLNT